MKNNTAEWLSTDEKPNKTGRYLVSGPRFSQVEIAMYDGINWFSLEGKRRVITSVVTNWNPLPAKPKFH